MQSPTTTASAGFGAGAATYTTIPISVSSVVSRSVDNISSALCRHRPWPEFLAAGVFHRPRSASDALTRIRLNSAYFRTNYLIIIASCGLVSLIGAPFSLILVAAALALWLIFYFFREDPLTVRGHQLSDGPVLAGLVLLSLLVVWFTGCIVNLVVGSGVGLLLCGLHGAMRSPEGLFLDESEAVSQGLIGSGTAFVS